jgi:hypothetical protein
MTSEEFLSNLVRKWEPTETQKQEVAANQRRLRELLHESRLPVLDSYLSGSYSRDTALRPIDDVDIVFIVEPSHWMLWPSFWRPEPSEVLDSFARAIRHRYTLSSVYGQRRSVNLRLSDLDIDVVPALSANEHSSAIYVPDRQASTWILSNPKEHARQATQVNRSQDGRLKPLVKLLKLWNSQLPSTAQVKSFLLETMALRIFRRNEIPSLSDGLVKFWDHMAYAGGEDAVFGWESVGIRLSWWSATVPDVAETGGDVAEGLESERRQKFVQQAISSRDKALASLRARNDSYAVDHWKRAFHLI